MVVVNIGRIVERQTSRIFLPCLLCFLSLLQSVYNCANKQVLTFAFAFAFAFAYVLFEMQGREDTISVLTPFPPCFFG